MTQSGQMAFSLMKESRSRIYSDQQEPVCLAPNYETQFKNNKIAWDFFRKQAPSYQKLTIHWIMNAKQETNQTITT